MEFNEPTNSVENDGTSPISRGSKPESDGLPSLVDEDLQLKARMTTMESSIKDLADLLKESLPRRKPGKQGPRQSGERSRLIYGDDLYELPDEDGYDNIPDLVNDSDSDSDSEEPEELDKKGSKRSSGKMRQSVMYERNQKDREQKISNTTSRSLDR